MFYFDFNTALFWGKAYNDRMTFGYAVGKSNCMDPDPW